MSFASSLVAPAARLLRGPTLGSIARGTGIAVAGAGFAALYQTMHEEMRSLLQHRLGRRQYKRERHDMVLSYLLGTDLAPGLQERIHDARDAWRECLEIFTDKSVDTEEKAKIRRVFDVIFQTGSQPG